MLKAALRALLLGFISLPVVLGGTDDNSCFAARRQALMKRIEGSIAILEGAPEPRAYASFRQDNNFYYLAGVEMPGVGNGHC